MTNYSDKLGAKGLTQAQVDARVVAVASGNEQLEIPVDLWVPDSADPPDALTTVDNVNVLPFGGNGTENNTAYMTFRLPKRWNAGTIDIIGVWAATSTSTNAIRVSVAAIAHSVGEAFPAFPSSTFATWSHGGVSNGWNYNTIASYALSSPAKADSIQLRFARLSSSALDTLDGINALFRSIIIVWTADAPTDD